MILFNKQGTPLEPVNRADLLYECFRLQRLLAQAVKELGKHSKAEAAILTIALNRERDYPQPEVGEGDEPHPLDNPRNANKPLNSWVK